MTIVALESKLTERKPLVELSEGSREYEAQALQLIAATATRKQDLIGIANQTREGTGGSGTALSVAD